MRLATISDTRDHPTHPLKIDLDVGDGALDIGWCMVAHGAWATVQRSWLIKGVQVAVMDTGITADPDKYRVMAIFPSAGLILPDNTYAPARRGDAVGISGSPKITPAVASTILAGLPPIMPIGHDLVGRIITDD